MKKIILLAALACFVFSPWAGGRPPVPTTLSYQGKVLVEGVNFVGDGLFKFALVDETGTRTYWSNDGTSVEGGPPTGSATLKVVGGLYSVRLGEEGVMEAIEPAVFAEAPDVRLRVWFNDGTHGFERLDPDTPIASVGYAMTTATVPVNSVGTAQLQNGAVTAAKIGSGQVGSAQLAANLTITGTIQADAFSGSFSGDGSGLIGVPGTFRWVEASDASTVGLANHGYTATRATLATVSLPTTSLNVGDTFRVVGAGGGGWRIEQSGGNRILSSRLGDVPGRNWVARESARNWQSIALSADGNRLAAVVSGGQIHTSTDGGISWTARESIRTWRAITSSSDGTKLAAAVQNGRIYTSTDGGISWTARESVRIWQSIASSADGTRLAAVVDDGRIYTSADSGVNWTARENTRRWSSIASSVDGTKLAAVAGFQNPASQIYTSIDSGVSWTARATERNWLGIASSSDGSELVAVALASQIHTSTDSGVSWTTHELSRDWFFVASSGDGATLLAAPTSFGPDQLYISSDAGTTWTARGSVSNWAAGACSADGTKLAAADYGGQIHTSVACTVNSISGAQGTALELQYLGDNTWAPLGFVGPFTFD